MILSFFHKCYLLLHFISSMKNNFPLLFFFHISLFLSFLMILYWILFSSCNYWFHPFFLY